MDKDTMKVRLAQQQGMIDVMTGEPLPVDAEGHLRVSLVDLHRKVQGKDGGRYTLANCEVHIAACHRDVHGNAPNQGPELARLRMLMNDYRSAMALGLKVGNSALASERRMSEVSPALREMYDSAGKEADEHKQQFAKEVTRQLRCIDLPIVVALRGIRGVGDLTIAEVITTLDPAKAPFPSSFWKYVGYAGPSKERYVKGVKGGGNKPFRSVMYNLAVGFLRCDNLAYRAIYDRRRAQTDADPKWASDLHRHRDALRIMVKHFLAHLWHVWRELEGLPTAPIYAEAHLAGHDTENPGDFGWEWEAIST